MEDGNFAEDIAEISFSEIPTLDKDSANFLGDRQMGTLSDMVSQFEYSNDSTQINYQGRPVRVAPIAYADLIKWFTNRSQGLPAYVIVVKVNPGAVGGGEGGRNSSLLRPSTATPRPPRAPNPPPTRSPPPPQR